MKLRINICGSYKCFSAGINLRYNSRSGFGVVPQPLGYLCYSNNFFMVNDSRDLKIFRNESNNSLRILVSKLDCPQSDISLYSCQFRMYSVLGSLFLPQHLAFHFLFLAQFQNFINSLLANK